ncbi:MULTISPECIES: hypothetical protein [Thermomonosporaceae]|uniref:hypothetical protein n=1 Tax=Thermomonosporaceae TaxID=2012 RepID=UPI00255A96D0|nr:MULTISPECIES: hypothetical protein [Thermomonosporaceae]MDL4774950.1 hypothetical protein [Actinomadura xylanilytica]
MRGRAHPRRGPGAAAAGVAGVSGAVLGVIAIALAIAPGRPDPLVLVGAGLALAVAGLTLAVLRLSRELRLQRRYLFRQIETQTRVLHNAARLAAERQDERR